MTQFECENALKTMPAARNVRCWEAKMPRCWDAPNWIGSKNKVAI